MAWSAVSAAGTSDGNSASLTFNSVGANVIVLIVPQYQGTPSTANISETGASANTWVKVGPQTAVGDSAAMIAMYYAISPNTNASHGITYTETSRLPSMIAFAFSQGAATTFGTSVSHGGNNQSTESPGTIGSGNQLLVAGAEAYDKNVSSIDSSFGGLTTVNWVNNQQLGTGGAWKDATGSETPTFTYSASALGPAAMALSFNSAGGGGGGVTYPRLERAQRGVNRGRNTGIARSFVRLDRIFVPAYAVVGDLKEAA